MRKYFFLTLSLIFLAFIGSMGREKASCQKDKTEGQIIKMLKEFYIAYITENSKIPENDRKIDSILKKCCTAKLIEYIRNSSLDYDPFINSQMCDIKMINTLNFKRDNKETNIFYASFIYARKIKTIKLSVINEANHYKIDHIYLEDYHEEYLKTLSVEKEKFVSCM